MYYKKSIVSERTSYSRGNFSTCIISRYLLHKTHGSMCVCARGARSMCACTWGPENVCVHVGPGVGVCTRGARSMPDTYMTVAQTHTRLCCIQPVLNRRNPMEVKMVPYKFVRISDRCK
jgi:hypothetical protein